MSLTTPLRLSMLPGHFICGTISLMGDPVMTINIARANRKFASQAIHLLPQNVTWAGDPRVDAHFVRTCP